MKEGAALTSTHTRTRRSVGIVGYVPYETAELLLTFHQCLSPGSKVSSSLRLAPLHSRVIARDGQVTIMSSHPIDRRRDLENAIKQLYSNGVEVVQLVGSPTSKSKVPTPHIDTCAPLLAVTQASPAQALP
jgi:hypothetical protein